LSFSKYKPKICDLTQFTALLHCRKPVATRTTPVYLMAERDILANAKANQRTGPIGKNAN